MRTTFLVIICAVSNLYAIPAKKTTLPPEQVHAIGKKIWQNECASTIAGLTSWNEGESFASLGIGHFIWFPAQCTAPYTQTFPDLLTFLQQQKIELPAWLAHNIQQPCPWDSRPAFLNAQESMQMKELRTFLSATIEHQAQFIVGNFEQVLPAMLKKTPRHQQAHIKKNFYRLAQTPQGLYVLIDYANFKGHGTNPEEQYQGYGWGLMQVLASMQSNTKNPEQAFVDAATDILTQRVAHAPADKDEKRFLAGWLNRLKTYTQTWQ
jgi:hypothetical protein